MSKLDDYSQKASFFTPDTDVVSLCVAKCQLSDVVHAIQESHNSHITRLTNERSELTKENERLKEEIENLGYELMEAYEQQG